MFQRTGMPMPSVCGIGRPSLETGPADLCVIARPAPCLLCVFLSPLVWDVHTFRLHSWADTFAVGARNMLCFPVTISFVSRIMNLFGYMS